jgi:uncharacterized protein YbdZ (MbtH family)
VPNADVAYVDVLPSAKNFLPSLNAAVVPAAASAGEQAGRSFGSSFSSSSTNAVERASTQMSTALRKTADAAGAVRVAEEKLDAVRSSGRATSVQIVSAEEGLAKARRNETAANENLNVATRRVADAQNQHTVAARQGSVAMDDTSKKAGVVSTSFGLMRNAVATGFAAFYAASTAVNFIGSAIKASSDLNETVNKSNIIFGSNAAAVDSWAKGAARNLGLSRAAALETAATFGNMYAQLGFSASAAANMSMKTVQLAADLGSFNNLPTAEVADMIAGAFRGEYDSLQRIIPTISDATVKSEAMAQTGKTNADSLTNQEKATAILSIITRDGAAAMGDFARTSGGLANQQKILSATWDDAKAALGNLLYGPATAFTGWLIDIIPKVQAFGGWIADNSYWLGPMAVGIGAVATAVGVWTVGQWALNAALAANPIGLVIVALAGIVAALVTAYTTSETFRNIVNAVFSAVGAAGMWLWTNALQPAFQYIGDHWRTILTAMVWTWDNLLHPAWNVIAAVATWLWANVLQPTFQYIGDHWRTILTAMLWAWDNILHPMWDALATVAMVLWTNVLQPVFQWIGDHWHNIVQFMKDVWDNILHPMWDLLAAVLNLLWVGVIKPIFDIIGFEWQLILLAMKVAWEVILQPMWALLGWTLKALWDTILHPIFDVIGFTWNALMWAMKLVYDGVLHPMMEAFKTVVQSVQTVFENVTKGIDAAWSRLRGIAAAPVNFVVRTVLRDGLFSAWNWVLDQLGIGTWKVNLQSSWLQGIAGYATGGRIQGYSPSKTADNIPIMATAGEYVLPVDSTSELRKQVGDGGLEMLRQGQLPKYYATGGQIADVVRAKFPQAVVTSTYRPGANDYHGSNNAADLSGGPGYTPAGTPFLASIKRWWYDNFGKNTEELIYNGIGADRANLKNGVPYPYSAGIQSQHHNHVHIAETGAIGGGAAQFAGVDASGSIDVPAWYSMFGSVQGVYDKIKGGLSRLGEITSGPFGGWIKELPPKLLGLMWDQAKQKVTDMFSAVASAIVGGDTLVSGTGRTKDDVMAVANTRGWGTGGQWSAIDWIIAKESGWNPKAQNPVSTASGLFQHIDSTWRSMRPASAAAFAHMKDAPVVDQAQAGMRYISSRYGDPLKAQAFWKAHNYYAQGGPVLPAFHDGGHTRHWNREHVALMGPDERVFTPKQDDYFRRFVKAAEEGSAGMGRRQIAENIIIHANDREEGRELVDRLWHKLRVADRGGVNSTFTV